MDDYALILGIDTSTARDYILDPTVNSKAKLTYDELDELIKQWVV